MKQQTGNNSQRGEKKTERPTKAEKVYNAIQKDKKRAEARKKEATV